MRSGHILRSFDPCGFDEFSFRAMTEACGGDVVRVLLPGVVGLDAYQKTE